MNIEGTYTLQASPEDIWNCLSNKEVLLNAFPGLAHLESANEGLYPIALHIKYPPLTGTYNGQAGIIERQAPYYCHITIEGEGRNAISGNARLHLNERNGNTVIVYKGTLSLNKPGSLLPAPVMKGTAKLLIQQFFSALADQLRTRQRTTIGATEEASGISVFPRPAGDIVILPPDTFEESTEKTPFTLSIVRLLGLGAQDPAQEAIWAQRIRRTGVIALLLLLVWVGTQLPGRFSRHK